MKYDVVALGELLIDFTMESVDKEGYPTMSGHPGGAPANYLAAVAKFGGKGGMISKVGDDAFGWKLVSTLQKYDIDTSGIIADPDCFTTLAFVTLDDSGDREFSFARKPGADICLRPDEVSKKIIKNTRILHFGSLSLTDEPARSATMEAVEYARSIDRIITFDPNLRPPLWRDLEEAKLQMSWGINKADILKISDEELEFIYGTDNYVKCCEKIAYEDQVSLIFVTLGKDGCMFFTDNYCRRIDIPDIPDYRTVDTTGAGDIFFGSAIWKLLPNIDDVASIKALGEDILTEAARFACTSASLSTTVMGGISSVQSLEDINIILNTCSGE